MEGISVSNHDFSYWIRVKYLFWLARHYSYSFQVNPQVSELIEKFEGAVDSSIDGRRSSLDTDDTVTAVVSRKRKRPPPPLIPISAVRQYSTTALQSESLELSEPDDVHQENNHKSISITDVSGNS